MTILFSLFYVKMCFSFSISPQVTYFVYICQQENTGCCLLTSKKGRVVAILIFKILILLCYVRCYR